MLLSLGIIFIFGIILGTIFEKLRMPKLLGMLILGIVTGPYCLNTIDESVLSISSELRRIALVIILTRAGLNLNLSDLKKIGRPAFLLCFVPAVFEISGISILAPILLKISVSEALVLGAVLAAVSPAVIVPKMLTLMENGYGKDKSIPQMLLAGASVDDVIVIVLFGIFTEMLSGDNAALISLAKIPISVILGTAVGIICGIILSYIFKSKKLSINEKVLITLSASFLLLALEDKLTGIITISALLSIMTLGITFNVKDSDTSKQLSASFSGLWSGAEILLFVLVGASVDVSYALNAGITVIILILLALIFRMAGVFLCMLKTPLNKKERIFCMISYTPKATVQAAIGSIPLSMGLSCGNIVLTAAVCAILITAPLGAFMIELTYKRLLSHS